MSPGRRPASPRPLPQGWRFEPADVAAVLDADFPDFASWVDNQNNVHVWGEVRGAVVAPSGAVLACMAAGLWRFLLLPDSVSSPCEVARWAVGVASGAGDTSGNHSNRENQR